MLVTDLSDWNDHINWSHMIGEGVEGVIVKISEGRTLSELHGKHIAGAAARGAFTATHTHRPQNGRKKRQRSSLTHWKLWDTARRPWGSGSM